MMLVNSMFAMTHQQYYSTVLFCVGLLATFLACSAMSFVESAFRHRGFNFFNSAFRSDTYDRFHSDLVSTTRHVAFSTSEIHELQDHDFLSE